MPTKDLPLVVMIKSDNYRGPCWPGTNLFPLAAITKYFVLKGESCSRTQFPVTLSCAVSIHKSQGLTMDRVVVDISWPGLRGV